MKKRIQLMIIVLQVLVSADIPIYGQQNDQEHISKIIKYFELTSIKEFDTVSFEKQVNLGNNKWRIGDNSKICYEYEIGFPSMVDSSYDFPKLDSLERLWISDFQIFSSQFPMKIKVPEKNIDFILRQNGNIDGKMSWMNTDVNEDSNNIFVNARLDSVFVDKNPYVYFKNKSRTMDSLGIASITQRQYGNFIVIVLSSTQGALIYLPDSLQVHPEMKNYMTRLVKATLRISKNWVWLDKYHPQ